MIQLSKLNHPTRENEISESFINRNNMMLVFYSNPTLISINFSRSCKYPHLTNWIQMIEVWKWTVHFWWDANYISYWSKVIKSLFGYLCTFVFVHHSLSPVFHTLIGRKRLTSNNFLNSKLQKNNMPFEHFRAHMHYLSTNLYKRYYM